MHQYYKNKLFSRDVCKYTLISLPTSLCKIRAGLQGFYKNCVHFRYIWLTNCSMINVIWTISLFAVLMDYFVCGPLKNILPPDSWDQKKEYTYSTISKLVSKYYLTCKLYVERFFKLRETNTILVKIIIIILYITYVNSK